MTVYVGTCKCMYMSVVSTHVNIHTIYTGLSCYLLICEGCWINQEIRQVLVIQRK